MKFRVREMLTSAISENIFPPEISGEHQCYSTAEKEMGRIYFIICKSKK